MLKPFAAEAWRRAEAGELHDGELYCSDAAWSGIFDRMGRAPTAEETARRVTLASHYACPLTKWRPDVSPSWLTSSPGENAPP